MSDQSAGASRRPTDVGADGSPLRSGAGSLQAKDLAHLARLSRLHLTDEEVRSFEPQIQKILQFVTDLDSVVIPEGTKPMVQPLEQELALRPDEAQRFAQSGGHSTVLQCAPEVEDGCFKVPPFN